MNSSIPTDELNDYLMGLRLGDTSLDERRERLEYDIEEWADSDHAASLLQPDAELSVSWMNIWLSRIWRVNKELDAMTPSQYRYAVESAKRKRAAAYAAKPTAP